MRTAIPALGKGLLLSFLVLLALPAGAATLSGLYEAEVPVSGEDTASRNQVIGEALTRVLVKLTGRDPAPGAEELAGQAARYVQQYRYRRGLGPDGEPQTTLWVRFDKRGLDRALRERGLPLWGSSRPGMLVWLAVETQGRRELAAADSPYAEALSDAAAARGLPLQWPLLDLEDQARLTAADLWSDYGPAVTAASVRYARPLVLAGRLRQVAPDHWDGRWTLYEDGQEQPLSGSGPDAATVIQDVVGRLVTELAARYAPAGGDNGPDRVRLQFTGVRNVDDYARLIKLIGERDMVERVAVRGAAADTLLLDVQVRGGAPALAQVLDLQHNLQREPTPEAPPPSASVPALPAVPEGVPPSAVPSAAPESQEPAAPATAAEGVRIPATLSEQAGRQPADGVQQPGDAPQPTAPAMTVPPATPAPPPAPPPAPVLPDLVYRLTP